eukprot:9503775-Pyramimonas_sp.AAC.1
MSIDCVKELLTRLLPPGGAAFGGSDAGAHVGERVPERGGEGPPGGAAKWEGPASGPYAAGHPCGGWLRLGRLGRDLPLSP